MPLVTIHSLERLLKMYAVKYTLHSRSHWCRLHGGDAPHSQRSVVAAASWIVYATPFLTTMAQELRINL